MRIVIAPDKFKGSLSSEEVGASLAAGIRSVAPDAAIAVVPMADGGEGTAEAAIANGFERRTARVAGPLGNPVEAVYAVRGAEAVVELAEASGLLLVPEAERDALAASSRGTGELILAALDAGAERIVLAVGGSASTDGGAGLLAALGARILDADGADLPDGGGSLGAVDRVDLSGLDPRIPRTRFVLAADVDHPLLGARGAAAVFGPQKGADPAQVERLDAGLARFAAALAAELGADHSARPGTGAAGGVGFAAIAALGAEQRPGAEVVAEVARLADHVAGAELVITGEGSFDHQSLGGKTPMGVLGVGRAAGVPVVMVCGRALLDEATWREAGFAACYALSDRAASAAESMGDADRLLGEVGREIAERLISTETATGHGSPDDTTPIQKGSSTMPEHEAQSTTEADATDTGAAPEAGDRYDLVVRGKQVLTTSGIRPREVGIRGGIVVALQPLGNALQGDEIIELADDETLIPGLVDTHVHVNEPGRTEWEGFASATRAAAAGGVTTILDMPLNSIPPTVDVEALEVKRAVARDQAFVDVGFWGGAVPGNTSDLRPLHDAGVFGFKCFLLHSGVDEFPPLDPDEMEVDMRELQSFDSMLIVHAEDSRAIDRAPTPEGDKYDKFLASRPRGAENIAIAEVIERARWTGARAHILHLSSSDALPMIRSAKRDGVKLTVETCPHYLTLNSEEIPDGGTQFKCCPPIREAGNREQLWEGLIDGTIDYIVSDHSPSTLDLKDLENGDFAVAWGGISSLQLGLSLIWTEARHRGVPLETVVSWMSDKPAANAGLTRKGRIALGSDADFSIFAADDAFIVDVQKLHHKNPITPYAGRPLAGVVRSTYLRGTRIDGVTPTGKLLRRGMAE
ncbi:allantoinase AllB [Leucobacter zeae]|nr:allantoinase AllB [Leucobacter zeae]